MHRSNQNVNIAHRSGKPRAFEFDYFLCTGSGEFDGNAFAGGESDLCSGGVGKIELEVSGFNWSFFFFGRRSRFQL